ncbi:hypothetical protein KO516_14120 [Citreicella sp. C3M06]|nr:hypothetical protein [Citreicella sp. C3M06]
MGSAGNRKVVARHRQVAGRSHVEQVSAARHGSGNVDVETFVSVRVGKVNEVVIHRGAGDEALFSV